MSISIVDQAGKPKGQTYSTHTLSHLGDFRVRLPHAGPVSIRAVGVYFNEVAGRISDVPIVLSAFYDASAEPEQRVSVNLITHLSYDRAQFLTSAGMSISSAIAQAERELIDALGLGPSGFQATVSGSQISLLTGNSRENAYLFLLSSTLASAAKMRPGSLEENLKEITKNVAVDLREDGALRDATTTELRIAESTLDPALLVKRLEQHIEELAGSVDIPQLHSVMDADRDGVSDDNDNCRTVANPNQGDANGNGVGDLCDLLDECASNNGGCDPLTVCTNLNPGRSCSACPEGYEGDGMLGCVDIDECAHNNGGCDLLTECTNLSPGRSCSACPEGYEGDGMLGCVDIDECAHNNGGCDPLTECTNLNPGRSCSDCPKGYVGDGVLGCVDIDECAHNNGGCDPLTECTNLNPGRSCSDCPKGYVGDGVLGCVDIDECAHNNGGCDPLTECTNLNPGRSCSDCPKGYVGDGVLGCVDIDECAHNNGGCDPLTECTNLNPGRSCSDCPKGYEGDGMLGCVDIDECANNNGGCDPNTLCTNLVPGYICATCPDGHASSDPYFDDVDENCDGLDGAPLLFDNFEVDDFQSTNWVSFTNAVLIDDLAFSGRQSLELQPGIAHATTRTFDTSDCKSILWSFYGRRGHPNHGDAPGFLSETLIQYFDGTQWKNVKSWKGNKRFDQEFEHYFGTLTAKEAFHEEFALRFYYNNQFLEPEFYVIDDIFLQCIPTIDRDADGYPIPADCNDHDASIHPSAPDTHFDTIDQNCDGSTAVKDRFELEAPDSSLWSEAVFERINGSRFHSGNYSIELSSPGQHLTSHGFDFTQCGSIFWSLHTNTLLPDDDNFMVASYLTANGWKEIDRWSGKKSKGFARRLGRIEDPSAFHDGFRLKLAYDGNSIYGSQFTIDDIVFGCIGDLENEDDDLAPDSEDCDRRDANIWKSCAQCGDADQDGFFAGCDAYVTLPPEVDCNDDDPSINAGSRDLWADGVDENCDGFDGRVLFDDFEGPDTNKLWAESLRKNGNLLVGSGAAEPVATTRAVDTTHCQNLGWMYQGRSLFDQFRRSRTLVLEYFNGNRWMAVNEWTVDHKVHTGEVLGTLSGDAWKNRSFAMRLTGSRDFAFIIDKFGFACFDDTQDVDQDGAPVAFDCDDSDLNNWFSCSTCVDADKDGKFVGCDRYETTKDCNDDNENVWVSCDDCQDQDGDGVHAGCDAYVTLTGPDCDNGDKLVWSSCDTCRDDDDDGFRTGCDAYKQGIMSGEDCDDADKTINPRSPDTSTDGIDQNCDNVDGLVLFREDLEDASSWPQWEPNSLWENSTKVTLSTGGGAFSGETHLTFLQPEWLATKHFDTRSCEAIAWSYRGYPRILKAEDEVKVEFYTSKGTWATSDSWSNQTVGYRERFGAIVEQSSFHERFAIRIGVRSDLETQPRVLVDDIAFGCVAKEDQDADGVLSVFDCDDTDPQIHKGAQDVAVDGIDQNCDGHDAFFDSFDPAGRNGAVWSKNSASLSNGGARSSQFSASFSRPSDVLETIRFDTTQCEAMFWIYYGTRKNIGLKAATLGVRFFNSAQWVLLDEFVPPAERYERRSGVITTPSAYNGVFGLQFGMAHEGHFVFMIDDIRFGCAVDNDEDGVYAPFDCNDDDAESILDNCAE